MAYGKISTDKISKLQSYRLAWPDDMERSGIMVFAPMMYRAADYLRLSQEDGDSSFSAKKQESNSISSQRELIQGYVAKCPDIELVAEFADDGYTGTNFDRPGFKRMMEAVERGEINCIIVKDLSRFGREYIDAGQYIEKLFPQKGIRFIAINDNYDSLTSNRAGDGLIVPFKNLINDSYSRDISIKVRSSLETKRRQGEFIANFAVYGYQRDPSDKNCLVVDEEAATTVRDIFRWKIEGVSPVKIAAKLNDMGILCPAAYKKAHGSRYSTSFQGGGQARWSPVSVIRILTNEVYCGVLVQGRRTTTNYKVKKVIRKDEGDWTRIEGTHEAIIDHAQFNLVQRLMNEDNRSAPGADTVHPLSGRVFCGDCEALAKRKVVAGAEKNYVYYNCPNGKKGGTCASRTISEEALEAAVLATLQAQIKIILDMDETLARIDALAWEKREVRKLDAAISVQQEKIEKSNTLKMNAYEDFRDGLIGREELSQIKEEFSRRIEQAQGCIQTLRSRKAELQEGLDNEQGWLAQFRQYRNIPALTRAVVVNLVDRILLYPDKQIKVELRHRDQISHVLEFLQEQSGAGRKEAV